MLAITDSKVIMIHYEAETHHIVNSYITTGLRAVIGVRFGRSAKLISDTCIHHGTQHVKHFLKLISPHLIAFYD